MMLYGYCDRVPLVRSFDWQGPCSDLRFLLESDIPQRQIALRNGRSILSLADSLPFRNRFVLGCNQTAPTAFPAEREFNNVSNFTSAQSLYP